MDEMNKCRWTKAGLEMHLKMMVAHGPKEDMIKIRHRKIKPLISLANSIAISLTGQSETKCINVLKKNLKLYSVKHVAKLFAFGNIQIWLCIRPRCSKWLRSLFDQDYNIQSTKWVFINKWLLANLGMPKDSVLKIVNKFLCGINLCNIIISSY